MEACGLLAVVCPNCVNVEIEEAAAMWISQNQAEPVVERARHTGIYRSENLLGYRFEGEPPAKTAPFLFRLAHTDRACPRKGGETDVVLLRSITVRVAKRNVRRLNISNKRRLLTRGGR